MDITAAKWGAEYIVNHAPSGNWYRGGEDGWSYRPQARICKVFNSQGDEVDGKFAVVDETGWDGYKEVPDQVKGMFQSWDAAMEVVNQIIR